MQSKCLESNIPISPASIDAAQIKILTNHLHYSIQRRLEDAIAFGQEALDLLARKSPDDMPHLENYLVLLEDAATLANNDWMLLDWVQLLTSQNDGM